MTAIPSQISPVLTEPCCSTGTLDLILTNFCFLRSEVSITVENKEFNIQKAMIREIKRYQKEVHGKRKEFRCIVVSRFMCYLLIQQLDYEL